MLFPAEHRLASGFRFVGRGQNERGMGGGGLKTKEAKLGRSRGDFNLPCNEAATIFSVALQESALP